MLSVYCEMYREFLERLELNVKMNLPKRNLLGMIRPFRRMMEMRLAAEPPAPKPIIIVVPKVYDPSADENADEK